MSNYITLSRLSISDDRVDYYFDVSDSLQKYFTDDRHLFHQYSHSIKGIPESILVIPFLGNVMQIAWLTDSKVRVKAVDQVFYASLLSLREAYRKMYPNCPLNGGLIAEKIVENHTETSGSAQMFTGGLDATVTFIRHRDEDPLLIQEYGFYRDELLTADTYSGDKPSEHNYQIDRGMTEDFAAQHGLQTAFVRSNYCTFVRSNAIDKEYSKLMGDSFWHGLHHAMAILAAAAPTVYQNQIRTLYIASSFSVGNKYPCASDPTTDNEFCFAGTNVVHDGYEMTDQDKARVAAQFQKELSRPLPLRVCSWNDRNCCSCEKCLRRILQLNAEGGDPRQFGFPVHSVFDTTKVFLNREVQFFTVKNIDKWRKIIKRSLENYENVYDKNVVNFLKEYNFEKEKKYGLYRYYYKNFFSIIRRKIKGYFARGK